MIWIPAIAGPAAVLVAIASLYWNIVKARRHDVEEIVKSINDNKSEITGMKATMIAQHQQLDTGLGRVDLELQTMRRELIEIYKKVDE